MQLMFSFGQNFGSSMNKVHPIKANATAWRGFMVGYGPYFAKRVVLRDAMGVCLGCVFFCARVFDSTSPARQPRRDFSELLFPGAVDYFGVAGLAIDQQNLELLVIALREKDVAAHRKVVAHLGGR